MLGGPLKGAVVPRGFITGYQRNFRVLFFANDEIVTCEEYRELVAFKELKFSARKSRGLFGRLGTAEWLMEDETPKRLDTGEPLEFLMQVKADFHFSIVDGAPHAVKMGIFGTEEISDENYYRLFISNELYIFVNAVGEPFPYLLTQFE